ncbi:MAG: hypothetical protein H6571_07300 [Lewinellaceae bacterium]|nr:hypothetical protein [Lewinellaceae bacterium]
MQSALQLRTIATFSFFILLSMFLFSKVWHRGEQIETSHRDQALERKKEKILKCEQYSLRALKSGWYPCTHCPKPLYWLNANEIAKYGYTCNKGARYTSEQLHALGVFYFIEFEGPLQEVVTMEAEKLFLYYKHPDNLRRREENRISLPPLNKRDD